MNDIKEKTIGEIVAEDYRTASVFESLGIDFCCKGNRTVQEACDQKSIPVEEVITKLLEATHTAPDSGLAFNSWELDALVDYIENKHHRYIERQTPVIKNYVDKLCKVHGTRHPDLYTITEAFHNSAGELAKHMKKEELILFPFIRQMVKAKETGQTVRASHFFTVNNPIKVLMQEHDEEGERFAKIAELCNHYTPPEDACNTYHVTYTLLKEFQDNLHLHIHLENNILFPKAIELEKLVSG
ncbi:MAG: iron-sulfur cluster repair di-iron protein [Chitinophagales bacterium]|nr:MAG: iron-sulfur cluster repair di-iron protein [Chitinophagales bacterium]